MELHMVFKKDMNMLQHKKEISDLALRGLKYLNIEKTWKWAYTAKTENTSSWFYMQ